MSVKTVFMGSPEFAVPSLEALKESSEIDLVLVVSQPDRPRGRGRRVSPTPVRQTAFAFGIPTEVMTKDNYGEIVEKIAALEPDVIVVVAFGMILRKDLLELPRYGCVNLHASLLPKYRGVCPVQEAIKSGDEMTGCTTMLMDEGVDTGDILLTEEIEILPDDTAGSLFNRLALLGADLLARTVNQLVKGEIEPREQDHAAATKTRKLKKEHGLIDWQNDAASLERFIRAMNPWPTAYTYLCRERLIILRAMCSDVPLGDEVPGTIVSLRPFVIRCGDGALEILEIKVPGKIALPAKSYMDGCSIQVGDVLDAGDNE